MSRMHSDTHILEHTVLAIEKRVKPFLCDSILSLHVVRVELKV